MDAEIDIRISVEKENFFQEIADRKDRKFNDPKITSLLICEANLSHFHLSHVTKHFLISFLS